MKIILKNTGLVFQSGTFDVHEFIDGDAWTSDSTNPEWKQVIVDEGNMILWGLYQDTTMGEYAPDLTGMTVSGVSADKIVREIKNIPVV